MHRVSVIIPVFNNFHFTSHCLQALARNASAPQPQVIVADNGSTDATAAECEPLGRQLFGGRFMYLRHEKNLGFACGCNAGAQAAGGEMLFFLNNDALCVDDVLSPLLAYLEAHSAVGAVGPVLAYPDEGRIQHAGVGVGPGLELQHVFEHFPESHPAVNRERRCQAVTAAAVLVPARLFHSLGGFDEEYVNGLEDVDLCARITAGGNACVCIPAGRLLHFTSSTPGRFDHEEHNFSTLVRKAGPLLQPDVHRLYAAEGYAMGLTEWLRPYPRLPRLRKLELLKQIRGNSRADLADLLEIEPCFDDGYDMLAVQLSQLGRTEAAAGVRRTQSLLCPSLANYEKLAAALSVSDPDNRLPEAAAVLQAVRAVIKEPGQLQHKAKCYAALAASRGDGKLAAVYEEWLLNTPAGGA